MLRSGLLDGAVDDLDGVEEGHGGAEVGADLFDRVAALLLAEVLELLAAAVLVGDEALGEGAVLDVVEELLHGCFTVGGDDARAG